MSGNFFSYYFSENSYRNRFFWSVFLLLLIHIAGAIGIAFYDTATFSGMTPYNLIIMFVILLLNENKIDEILILVFVFSFLIGFITELIGVNTGFLFGDYVYGKILGIKFFNVPILIGLNWFTIVFSAYVISAKIINYLPTLFFKKMNQVF